MDPSLARSAPVPYTLLGVLLSSHSADSVLAFDGTRFARDYVERATNLLLWLALVFVTAVLVWRFVALLGLWIAASRIPGPPFGLFRGRSGVVPGGGDLADYLLNLHEKYGPIVRLWFGPTQLLVSVTDPSAIREVLVKVKDKFPLDGRLFHLALGRLSLFSSSFEKVKVNRESLVFLLNKRFYEYANTIPLKVVDLVFRKIDLVDRCTLDCQSVSQRLAFYIVGATIFGDGFFRWSNAAAYEELLMETAKNANIWAPYKFPPFWKRGFWRYQFQCLRLKYLTNDIIQQCTLNDSLFNQLSQDSCNRTVDISKGVFRNPTLLLDNNIVPEDFHLDKVYQDLRHGEESLGSITGVMLHGFLRTTSLVCSVLARLALLPEIQEQVYMEVIEVSKEKSEPEMFDIHKMQLLVATICESARLLPEGTLLHRVTLKHELNLNSSITAPAGSVLLIPIQLVQMDYSIWGTDACQFNPQRFLSTSIGCVSWDAEEKAGSMQNDSLTGSLVKENSVEYPYHLGERSRSASFLPFGFGSRACIGEKYVIHGISSLFARLLHDYEIKLQPGFENDTKPIMENSVVQLLPNPRVVFVKRIC